MKHLGWNPEIFLWRVHPKIFWSMKKVQVTAAADIKIKPQTRATRRTAHLSVGGAKERRS